MHIYTRWVILREALEETKKSWRDNVDSHHNEGVRRFAKIKRVC